MTTRQGALVGAAFLLLTAFAATAQSLVSGGGKANHTARPLTGSFHSLTLNQPPFPFNPFPDLPVTQIKPGVYVYDDRSVEYVALRAEIAAKQAEDNAMMSAMKTMQVEDEESMGGGGMALMMGGSGPRLSIELVDGLAKRVSFNTQTGLVYRVEQSTNLQNWTLLETIVAESTNEAFFSFEQPNRFYRVIQNDDRIQFPDWQGFIEQYLNFDVWSSIQGTYHLELYGDGSLLYQTTQTVPVDGRFGVYDGQYDPNQWPNTGYYSVNNWELRVTVTPAAASQGSPQQPAQATVTKKSRRRNANRQGVTVQQYNAFAISVAVQEEIDNWMVIYFLSCYQGAPQVALDGSALNEFTTAGGVPSLYGTNWWSQLKNLVLNRTITDLHYFGHGGVSIIGSNRVNEGLTVGELKSSLLTTNPMTYVALDGCRTSENTDMLRAYIGHSGNIPRSDFREKGWDVRFGWGWKNAKPIGFVTQGTLLYKHFYFVGDYYYKLTERDPFNGYMLNTYEEAINFGQHPNPNSAWDPFLTRNTAGDSINYVGCYDCFFDE